MAPRTPLWPATLHHFRLNSGRPRELARFYERGFGMRAAEVAEGQWLLTGPQRRLLIGGGENETVAYAAYALDDPACLERLQRHLEARGVEIASSPSPLFGNAAFAVRDPDGQALVFGVPQTDVAPGTGGLPGRLQHLVFGTARLDALASFYEDALGFVVSDRVIDDGGRLTACFLRSDEEHHSYAAFATDRPRYDHHALEATCWNDIRDWADHFAGLRVPLWWGPGRHGPGNNLFFMIRDPDGNRIELSAELERMPLDQPARTWPHEEHTLNLWGQAWMRS